MAEGGFSEIYRRLSQFPEELIEAGIQAAIEAKTSRRLQDLLAFVGEFCRRSSGPPPATAETIEAALQVIETARAGRRRTQETATKRLQARVKRLTEQKVSEYPAHRAERAAEYAFDECMRRRLDLDEYGYRRQSNRYEAA